MTTPCWHPNLKDIRDDSQVLLVFRKVFKTSGELERIGMPDDQLESGADESEE